MKKMLIMGLLLSGFAAQAMSVDIYDIEDMNLSKAQKRALEKDLGQFVAVDNDLWFGSDGKGRE